MAWRYFLWNSAMPLSLALNDPQAVLFQLWLFSYSFSYSYFGGSWSLCVQALFGQNSKVLQNSMTQVLITLLYTQSLMTSVIYIIRVGPSNHCPQCHDYSWYFLFMFKKILFWRPFISLFLLPAVSSPQTENTCSTYASDAGADNKSCARGAKRGYFISITIQKSNPLSCAIIYTLPCLMQWSTQCNLTRNTQW